MSNFLSVHHVMLTHIQCNDNADLTLQLAAGGVVSAAPEQGGGLGSWCAAGPQLLHQSAL